MTDTSQEEELLIFQMKKFRDNVVVQDRTYRFRTYPQCFVGSEAVDVLMKLFDFKNRQEAVKLGRKFMDRGLFFHVVFEHTFKDGYYFYRFNDIQYFPGGMTDLRLSSQPIKKIDIIKKNTVEDTVEENTEEHLKTLNVSPPDEYNTTLVYNVHPQGWNNPQRQENYIYNLVVLGAGTGGLVTAAASAGLGASVALVEKHLMGGDCLNVGCVPSKALLRCARNIREIKNSEEFGVKVKGYEVDFSAIMKRMRSLRAGISYHDSAHRFKQLGVDMYFGNGKFVAKDVVQVGDRALKFKKAVIATGTRPAVPNISGLKEAGFYTNETIFNLTKLPKRLGIIGPGPIGCEMAQAFQMFGSQVYLFGRSEHLLRNEDEDAVKILEEQFIKDGIKLMLKSKYIHVKIEKNEKIIVVLRDGKVESIAVDEILVCTGREPNVTGIGLEIAGVKYDKLKGITVNDYLQTTNPNIYAVGDCCFKYKYTHASDFTARIVIRNALFFGREKASELIVPWATYTYPEIAHVGLCKLEASKKGIKVTTFTKSFEEIDRAILDGESNGFIKIHVKEGTDKILGATIVANHAGDLISQITTLMHSNVGLQQLATVIFPYPTQAEAIRKMGDDYNRTRLTPTAKQALETLLAVRKYTI